MTFSVIRKLFVVAFSTFLMFSGVSPVGATFKPDRPGAESRSPLSENGQRAFADLGRCLQSQGKEKVLDVFYLIDESASLQGTDSENKRADILSSSLIQLASFRTDVTVNYSVAFFAKEYGVWKSWTTLNRGGVVPEARRLEEEVRVRNEGRGTNWLIGINGAIEELNAQQERTNGCSTLIWLTDGGILLETEASTVDAIDQLCSNRFDVLRKNNVTVLGILLKNEEYLESLPADEKNYNLTRMAYMQPMVEGTGRLFDNSAKSCGAYPVPKNYRQGALFVAQDPKDLAFEFLKLPPQIEGCTESPSLRGRLSAFKIENGISGFQIVSKSPTWRLTDPTGKSLLPNSKEISVFQTAGATQIKVGTTQSGVGSWKFAGDDDSVLYLCAGLDIVIDSGNDLIAGRPGSLSGKVILQRTGQPANLDVYASNHPITVQQIAGDGSSSSPVEASQSAPSSFTLENFTPTAGKSELEIRVTLYLTTKDGFELAPISVSQKLEVRLPENYPSLKSNPIRLSDLQNSTEPASGEAVFNAPVGTDGKVCIAPNTQVKVISDSVDRAASYGLKTSGVDVNGCIFIRDGESQGKISIQVTNDVTASSDVVLEIPVVYYSDAEPGKSFTLAAPIEFTSMVPGQDDAWKWTLLLTILGILFPLGLIYLMSWLTTKIAFGRQVQRAAYPVMLTPTDRYTGRDGNAIAIDGADFKIRPEQPDVRSFDDSVGTFRTKISKLVLPAPWFEVKASEGTRVITLAHAAPQLKHRFSSGKLAPIPGDMGKIWALQVTDTDLANFEKSTPIPGTLVIFKRNNLANPNQFRDVFNGVTTKAGMWREVTRLAEVVKNESVKPEKEGKRKKGGNGGGSTPPPSTPPPGPGRPGGTPPRPGSSGPAPIRPGSGSSSPIRPGSSTSSSSPAAPSAPSTSSRPSGATTPTAPPPRPGSSQPPKRV
jgi:hypothetical protein